MNSLAGKREHKHLKGIFKEEIFSPFQVKLSLKMKKSSGLTRMTSRTNK